MLASTMTRPYQEKFDSIFDFNAVAQRFRVWHGQDD